MSKDKEIAELKARVEALEKIAGFYKHNYEALKEDYGNLTRLSGKSGKTTGCNPLNLTVFQSA